MVFSRWSSLGALTLACASARAQSAGGGDPINPDRPGIADGSTVVGKRRSQLETGLTYEKRPGSWDLQLPTLLRFGLDERWEIRVEGNGPSFLATSDSGRTLHTSGYAPVSLGAKLHLQDSGGLRKPSLGLIARVFPPSGSGDFRTRQTTGDVRLAADWDVASPRWSLNPNVGVGAYEDGNGERYTAFLGALTVNYWPTKTLNYFVDGGLNAPESRGGRNALTLDGGVAIITDRNTQLDLSVGTGVSGTSPARPFVSVGYSRRF